MPPQTEKFWICTAWLNWFLPNICFLKFFFMWWDEHNKYLLSTYYVKGTILGRIWEMQGPASVLSELPVQLKSRKALHSWWWEAHAGPIVDKVIMHLRHRKEQCILPRRVGLARLMKQVTWGLCSRVSYKGRVMGEDILGTWDEEKGTWKCLVY